MSFDIEENLFESSAEPKTRRVGIADLQWLLAIVLLIANNSRKALSHWFLLANTWYCLVDGVDDSSMQMKPSEGNATDSDCQCDCALFYIIANKLNQIGYKSNNRLFYPINVFHFQLFPTLCLFIKFLVTRFLPFNTEWQ